MAVKKTKLAIFDTFKTSPNKITGEAARQRAIINHLASTSNSASKTRTAISQTIAEKNNILWKNIYSGIFRDLDEVLIPLGIVVEEGRLPLKRGPKVLQENGMPYYHLTKKGLLVALSISDSGDRDMMMNEFFAGEYYDTEEIPIQEMLTKLQNTAPKFTFSLFERYTKAYCDGKISDLLPFNISNLKKTSDNSSHIQMELLEGFVKMANSERIDMVDFLKKIE
ncbi:MAG: hypothetical protein QF559_01975 [Candidatus Nitrosopelagicus sp.]|jgi:hypothetical protein|nr:hypothetical protein [Candidatus Nitrosopelagicus sp.]